MLRLQLESTAFGAGPTPNLECQPKASRPCGIPAIRTDDPRELRKDNVAVELQGKFVFL
jgi:hypothetical protein